MAVRAAYVFFPSTGAYTQPLAVRLFFTLGNLTASDDDNRKELFHASRKCELLLELFEDYINCDAEVCGSTPAIVPAINLPGMPVSPVCTIVNTQHTGFIHANNTKPVVHIAIFDILCLYLSI